MVVSAEKKAEYNKRYYLKHREEQIERVRNNQTLQSAGQNHISYARQEYNRQYYLAHRKPVEKVQEEEMVENLRNTPESIKEDLKYKNKAYYKEHKNEIKRKRNTEAAKAKRAAYNKSYYQKKKEEKRKLTRANVNERTGIYTLF